MLMHAAKVLFLFEAFKKTKNHLSLFIQTILSARNRNCSLGCKAAYLINRLTEKTCLNL